MSEAKYCKPRRFYKKLRKTCGEIPPAFTISNTLNYEFNSFTVPEERSPCYKYKRSDIPNGGGWGGGIHILDRRMKLFLTAY